MTGIAASSSQLLTIEVLLKLIRSTNVLSGLVLRGKSLIAVIKFPVQ